MKRSAVQRGASPDRSDWFWLAVGAVGTVVLLLGLSLPWWRGARVGVPPLPGTAFPAGSAAGVAAVCLLISLLYDALAGRPGGLVSVLLAGAACGGVLGVLPLLREEARADRQAVETLRRIVEEVEGTPISSEASRAAPLPAPGLCYGFWIAIAGAAIVAVFAVRSAVHLRRG